MIPKKSKYALTVTLLALSTACLATGCKKKHDKINLSGSQAAESTVQTAPVSTTATESESSSSITIEPGIENAQSQGTSAGGAATSLSLSVKTDTYQNGNVSIQYPVISDNSVKPEINDHLKDNALSILKAWEIDEAKDTLNITCKVLSATKNRITVRYDGNVMTDGGIHPTAIFYTNTISLSSGSDIGLSYLADAETEKKKKTFLKESDQSYYTALFQNADFPYQETFPECFSYEYEGSIYFSLPVAHALGDYILAVYTPENK